jgi:hypothetical protein
VDIGGLWTETDSDGEKEALRSGRFVLDLARKPAALATAAPGMAVY